MERLGLLYKTDQPELVDHAEDETLREKWGFLNERKESRSDDQRSAKPLDVQ
jgi:hypothetical protein